MQTRATKVFLPQTYQQYLQHKKKISRQLSITRPILHPDSQRESKIETVHPPSKRISMTDLQHQQQSKQQENQVKIVQKIVYSDFKNLFDQFQNNKFEAISKKIQLELQKLKQDMPLKLVSVNQIMKNMELQSLENIRQIQEQLKVPFGKRNCQKLDQMLSFNKFFVILNKEKRWKIYQNSSFLKYEPNKIVYQQGQPNQFMFVIIKGCVKQYQVKQTSYQQKVRVNFISHYEGSNFGEAPLVGDPNIKAKRYNSVQTTEATFLLQISNVFYKQLITNSAEDDFEKKIATLMQTTIFKDTSKLFVTPLLPTLEKIILPYGKVLIRQGQDVRQLYFVAQGNLQVMLLDRAKRTVKHLNIEEKPENFYLKKPHSKQKSRSKSKNYSIHNTFYYPETQQGQKQFIYGNKKLIGDELEYNQQIVFSTFRYGDFFGGKSFLQAVERQKKMINSKYFDVSLKAKLSILSSAPKTIIYTIDQKKFFSLSDNFQKLIIEGIMQTKYFDEQDIQIKVQQKKQWKKYSQKLVQNVIKNKKAHSSSFRN